MQRDLEHWVGVLAGGALAGLAFGAVGLALGFFLKVRTAGVCAFFACVAVGVLGGLRLLAVTAVIAFLPVIGAWRTKRREAAQPTVQPDVPASCGSAG